MNNNQVFFTDDKGSYLFYKVTMMIDNNRSYRYCLK